LIPALASLGIDAVVKASAERQGTSGKCSLYRHVRRADVVVLQRVLPPMSLLRSLLAINPTVVFDFDDALYTVPALRGRLEATLSLVREVSVGSETLAHYARRFARRVTVIPTTVNTSTYAPAEQPPAAAGSLPLRLGWIGSGGAVDYLEVIRPALRRLKERGLGFALLVISSRSPDWPELTVEHVPWSLEQAPRALGELDVGLAPLPDTEWTRGKCGLKVLEYMASGLPVVASPVGAASEIVVHGQTGFLAQAESEWVEHLERLSDDPQLRRQLGADGRRRAEERYRTDVAAGTLAVLLRRAATSSPKSRAWAARIRAASK
jgi:glycosyltransferase involved in cell wall biosynthesis